jgi:hypothetical protein
LLLVDKHTSPALATYLHWQMNHLMFLSPVYSLVYCLS